MIAEKAVVYLIGQLAELGGRVHPDRLPQGETRPAATYQRIATEVEHKLNGPCGTDHALFQIEVHAESRLESIEISRAIRLGLAGFLGLADGIIVGGVSIAGGERCTINGPNDGSDKYTFIASQDYRVTTCEAVE